MVSQQFLENSKSWFGEYTQSFLINEREFDQNILLKQEHTYRVCKEMTELCRSIELADDLARAAEMSALFHDIGRFEQYKTYKTFVDKHSENHAELGLKIIDRLELLEDLSENSRRLIKMAIANHNRAAISNELTENELLLAKLLRDADKLDIWKVVTDYYKRSRFERNPAIELHLPDENKVSEKVFADLVAGRIINSADLKNLNDFKILQLAWVFDLNFDHSRKEFVARGFLKMIADTISDAEIREKVVGIIQTFLQQN
jgi:putative nucleotidyltransferase with HDIG domain